MQSVILPNDITIEISNKFRGSSFLKRIGPRGISIKKRGDFKLSILNVEDRQKGPQIFVSGVCSKQESVALSRLWDQAVGLSRGYRKRLRLVGIGFRGVKQSIEKPSAFANIIDQKAIVYPKHRERGLDKSLESKRQALVLKLGFSHDSGYFLDKSNRDNVRIDISQAEGRTKGTVIFVEGSDLVKVSANTTEIQNLRKPDVYKGKGIHADGVALSLKKGKRQG